MGFSFLSRLVNQIMSYVRSRRQKSAQMILQLPARIDARDLGAPDMMQTAERILKTAMRLSSTPIALVIEAALDESPLVAVGPDLIDDLSSMVCPSNQREAGMIRRKALEEEGWSGSLFPNVQRWVANEITLLELLTQSTVVIFGARSSVRACAAGIVADSQGRQIIFPPPDMSIDMIATADRIARVLIEKSPMLAAVFIMASVVHAHPFPDGNGRVSRTVFSSIVQWCSASQARVPILALECLSYRSYLVRVRRAQCLGVWQPLVSHISAALDLLADRVSVAGGSASPLASRLCRAG